MLPFHDATKFYTIRRGNKTVSARLRSTDFVIGFRNPTFARNVMHNLHPEPHIVLLRDADNDLGPELASAGLLDADISLNLDVSATLFVPKAKGSSLDPMHDGGYHVHTYSEDDFLTFPLSKHIGTVMPYSLLDETEDEFVFRTLIMDPATKKEKNNEAGH